MEFDDSSDSDIEFLNINVNRKRRKIVKERINMSIDDFEMRFRLSRQACDFVLSRISHMISHPTNKSKALSPQQQLLVTLRFLATGAYYHVIADCHGLSRASVCRSVKDCVYAINHALFPEIIRWPQNCQEICRKFYDIAGVPSVCGCIDGTYIVLEAPRENEVQFVNRKGDHAINAMAVCGPDYRFYYVSARWPGAVNDARVLRNSTLYAHFETGWRPFINGVLLADSAYPLKDWIIPPLQITSTAAEGRFNAAHKKTRRIIENSFGILKERFSCLYKLRLQPTDAGEIFKACCTLHNLCSFHSDMPDLLDEPPMDIDANHDYDERGMDRRRNLIRHFE